MSLMYSIDPAAGVLHVVGEGVINQAERLAAIRSWMRDPAYRRGLRTLCDFSAVASTPRLSELREIVSLIQLQSPFIGPKRLAMIAPSSTVFGVARQFQSLAGSSPLEIGIFRDRAQAAQWLGLETP
jgi:hypothetical protein